MKRQLEIEKTVETADKLKKRNKREYPTELPDTGLVRLPTVLCVYPAGKSTVYSQIKKGTFPVPIKLADRISAWDVNDIREVIAKRKAGLVK